MEEVASLEMEHHLLDKEDGCDDSTDAAFSDDEEEVNTRGDPLWFLVTFGTSLDT